MKAMSKEYFILSQMMIVTGLLEHTKDNLEDTEFEDEEALETIVETLAQGCNIAVLRMKQIIKDADEDGCDCY
jgi:hypothetical protein